MSLQQWLQHGEMLYQSTMQEYHALEAQMDELERRLAAKLTEVNQVAQMLGKPPIEASRRVAAQIVSPQPPTDEIERALLSERPTGERAAGLTGTSSATNNIARALTGKTVRQPV